MAAMQQSMQRRARCWHSTCAGVGSAASRPAPHPAASPLQHPRTLARPCAHANGWVPQSANEGAEVPSGPARVQASTLVHGLVHLAASRCALALQQSLAALQRAHRAFLRHQAGRRRNRGSHQWLALGALAPGMPVTVDPLTDLLSNTVFMSAFWAWFLAQFGKIFTHRFKKGVWDIRALVSPGGTPSSHSSLCSGVTTALALSQGLGSPIFAVSLAFSCIVMYDAMGVRRHAGKQAEVLNQVIDELMDDHPLGGVKLKEVLGHTPRQVLAGAVLGVIVALAYPHACARLA